LSAEHYKAWNNYDYIFVMFLLFHFSVRLNEIDARENRWE
jgi:hypothetical protein